MTFRIEVAPEPSFCPGVRRAFQITTEMLIAHISDIAYSAGPLIHNHIVTSMLADMGLETLDPDSDDLPPIGGIPVVIRSHGVDSSTEKKLQNAGAIIYDATCPKVKRVQDEAVRLASQGYTVVVAGSPKHPEVRSIVGRVEGDVVVLDNLQEAKKWSKRVGQTKEKIGIVSQTTRSKGFLDSVAREIQKHNLNVVIKDTTCESVSRRMVDAVNLTHVVDLIIIVGGKNSSNTSHLASICFDTGVPTYWIEQASELNPRWFEGVSSVGVTGGTSTPDWQIEEVVFELESLSEKMAGGPEK